MTEQMSEADRKRTLYVGGVSEKMKEETLKAAFIAFGDIKDVQIPLDMATGKSFFFRRRVTTATNQNEFGQVRIEDLDSYNLRK